MTKKVPQFLFAQWPAPAHVHACMSMRMGGVSDNEFNAFNLSDDVGDNPDCVTENRSLLKATLKLPDEPIWLQQVHSARVIEAGSSNDYQADATVCFNSEKVCAVMTADCLPILLCSKSGTCIAAIHAGWRGLAANIIGITIESLQHKPVDLLVWLGACIGPDAYQVGDEMRSVFLRQDREHALAFLPDGCGKWIANLRMLAITQLKQLGIKNIYGVNHCTYTNAKYFFSYRRNGQTGRMASLIWMDDTTV